jgi:hypothetical protein
LIYCGSGYGSGSSIFSKFFNWRGLQHGGGERHCRHAITLLWNAMEEELWKLFCAKRERNKVKNKPERFHYLAEAVPDLLESKRILIEQKLYDDKAREFEDDKPKEFEYLETSKCILLFFYDVGMTARNFLKVCLRDLLL